METVFQLAKAEQIKIITSVVTLTEVLTKPLASGDHELEKTYRELFEDTEDVGLIAINAAIANRAAYLRAQSNLKTPDALQIAVALETACDACLTNDLGMKRVTDVLVLVLDELEP